MPERLIKTKTSTEDLKELDTALVAIAKNIENSFLKIKAIPGEEYSKKDLISLAMQFINKNPETKYSINTNE